MPSNAMVQAASLTPNFLRQGMDRLRQGIRHRLDAMQTSTHPAIRLPGRFMYMIWRTGGDGVKTLLSPGFRSVRRLKTSRHPNLHQISNFTEMDRYPVVFNACRRYYPKQTALRLLSFGCSTGEEVLTLGNYFPNARIVGIDINPWNLNICQQRCDPTRMTFYHTDDPAWQSPNTYDLICCMAVLQRTENRTQNPQNSSRIYPFERFDQQLTQLDRYLKQGGLMVLDETDYRFDDATIAGHYQPLAWDKPITKKRYFFDRDNQKINFYLPTHRIFIKYDL